MKFLVFLTFVSMAAAQIATFPNFPPNFGPTTTANRQFLPPMEPMVPNFPIFPTLPSAVPFATTTTIRPRPPTNNNNNRPPLQTGSWRAGVADSRCPTFSQDFPVYLADATNCRRFFMCNAGYAWPMLCPTSVTGNVVWSQSETACTEVENPRC